MKLANFFIRPSSMPLSANLRHRPPGYVLDVILHSKVIQTNAHATDMRGFSEVNFALTGLIDVELRPRFVTIHRQRLYKLLTRGPSSRRPTRQQLCWVYRLLSNLFCICG